ncbi:hypothetical protein ACSS31_29535 (plasmid) [Priestia megaterium]
MLPIRLPESIYEQFRERCEELGLSMSEAGYLLIREELEENLYTMTTNEVAATTGRIQKSIQDENTPYIKKLQIALLLFLVAGRQHIMRLKMNYLVLYATNGTVKLTLLVMPRTIIQLQKSS